MGLKAKQNVVKGVHDLLQKQKQLSSYCWETQPLSAKWKLMNQTAK